MNYIASGRFLLDDERLEDEVYNEAERLAMAALRRKLEPALVQLLEEFGLLDQVGFAFFEDGIVSVAILAGRNAGPGGGGIQPHSLVKDFNLRHGVAIDLKRKAIQLEKAVRKATECGRPACSPPRRSSGL